LRLATAAGDRGCRLCALGGVRRRHELRPVEQRGAHAEQIAPARRLLSQARVSARDYKELIIWQLANELRAETLRLLRRSGFHRDWDVRREARKTASQVCRPIPEGFRRRSHGEFAQFLQYSLASLGELRDLFDDIQQRHYLTARELQPARNLCYRLERALLSFIRYLRHNDPPPWWR